jgi:hypothetical protein
MMKSDTKILITAGAYAAAFLVIATLAFCFLMAVANSKYVPWMAAHRLDGAILGVLLWGAALVLPIFVARFVWRRLGRQDRN